VANLQITTTQQLLVEAKDRLHITQKKMASILGITPTYVHEIIHGKKSADGRLFDFASKLEVDIFSVSGQTISAEDTEVYDHLKIILTSGEGATIETIKRTLRELAEKVMDKKELKVLRKTRAPGRNPDTTKKPAKRIGKNEKAA